MSNAICPFCKKSVLSRVGRGVFVFSCGTFGPYQNGEYTAGHDCDIATKDAEIERLTRERDERENDVGLGMEAEYRKGYEAGLSEGREGEG